MVSVLIAKYCMGISAALVAGIIHVESSGNPKVSARGNHGLMQVRLNTAKFMSCDVYNTDLCEPAEREQRASCKVTKPAQLLDPDTNVACGCKYLRYQKKRYAGNKADMAAAYNLGSVFRLEDGTYRNQEYVEKVNRAMKGKLL